MKHHEIQSTTVVAVRKNGSVVLASDGQVTFGDTVMKHRANKIRRLYHDRVLTGFAGAAADAFTLFEKLEARLETYNGNLTRAAVELAKEWRTDKMLRRLEAMLIAADSERSLIISGSGDVIDPDHDVLAIGSGGPYALAAARAMMKHSDLAAADIAREALEIAGEICIYTNNSISIESIDIADHRD
jgi:ATP-dependent HslUV protease subunit HslV